MKGESRGLYLYDSMIRLQGRSRGVESWEIDLSELNSSVRDVDTSIPNPKQRKSAFFDSNSSQRLALTFKISSERDLEVKLYKMKI